MVRMESLGSCRWTSLVVHVIPAVVWESNTNTWLLTCSSISVVELYVRKKKRSRDLLHTMMTASAYEWSALMLWKRPWSDVIGQVGQNHVGKYTHTGQESSV